MEPSKNKKVAIVYKNLPQYRKRFFELLKDNLAEKGIELILIYGQPGRKDAYKKDTVDLPWATKIDNKIFNIGSKELYWQPCLKSLKDVDLVIVEQASKLLLNYYLLFHTMFGKRKMAFWGHGRNFQSDTASSFGEKIKKLVSRHVHWWFSYNDTSVAVVRSLGFPEERITNVQNAIDTKQLKDISKRLNHSELIKLKAELNIDSDNICIYAGGMYAEKRLEFLLRACLKIKEQVPDFHMIFMGAGVDEYLVQQASSDHSWIHYVGTKFNAEKVPYFKISKLFLMPGLVGLAVLDTFALEVPIVTTDVSYHSPEIEYLKNEYNGIILKNNDDEDGYAQIVTDLLKNSEKLKKLTNGCAKSGAKYTVEEMALRFAAGVNQAIGLEEISFA